MAATPNSQTIAQANLIISTAQQMLSLYQTMLALDASWTDDGVATALATLNTVAVNSDGTLGTADGTPNSAHPINPAIYPTITRAVSVNQLTLAKTIMDGFVSYIGGQAVTTQVSARLALNTMVGG
jgi:hypothetical protein